MNIQRKFSLLTSGKSPSLEAMKRTYNRAFLSGGTTQDFSVNVENIRDISRTLGYNILKTPIQRNLLLFSEDFIQNVWVKNFTSIVATTNLNAFGKNKSFYLQEDNTINLHYLYQLIPFVSGNTYTASFYVKKADDTWIQFTFSNIQFPGVWVNFNFDTGQFGNNGGNCSFTKTDLGNGWWEITLTGLSITPANGTIGSPIGTNNTDSSTVALLYTGINGHKICEITAIQIESGPVSTNYQPTQSTPIDGDFTNANFLYVPSSYGELRNFAQVQNKRNLLQWSEDLTNIVWSANRISIILNSNLNPFNINKSYYLVDDNQNNSHVLLQNSNITVGLTYTISFYAKKADDTWCQFVLGANSFGLNAWANFNFDTGLFGNKGVSGTWSRTIISNGYYLITVTTIAVATDSLSAVAIGGTNNTDSTTRNLVYIGTNRKFCDVAAIQLEVGSYTTTYQKTAAAGDGIVDFNFTRATSSRVTNKQGIIEDTAYNLLSFSEEFDNVLWSKQNCTITINSIIAPNGTLTADKLLENAANTSHNTTYQSIPRILAAGVIYTLSFYIKATLGRDLCGIYAYDGSNGVNNRNAYFNITTGTVLSTQNGATGQIIDAGNGWWRCSMTFSFSSLSVPNADFGIYPTITDGLPTYTGDTSKGIYIWGAQLVVGSTPRPYLKSINRLNVPKLDYSNAININRNLLLFSQDFSNSIWIKGNTTITNANILSPINGISYFLNEGSANNVHYISQDPVIPNFGITHTVSWYIKKADHSWVQLTIGATFTGTDRWRNFNFDTGLFGNGVGTFVATYLSNGWWLITTVAIGNGVSASSNIVIGTNNTDSAVRLPTYIGTNNNISVISIMQLETGSTATNYQQTINTTFLGFEPSLLIEPARTNIVIQSQTFNVSWAAQFITLSADVAIAPDGQQTGDKIIETTANGIHRITSPAYTINPSTTYTVSVYVKASGRSKVSLNNSDGLAGLLSTFDLINLTADTTNSKIINAGNGWYRCSFSRTMGSTVGSGFMSINIIDNNGNISYIGDGVSGLFIWGAQVEVGVNSTTYIPTTTATVIRNTETNYIDLFNNALLNKSGFTLYWEGFMYDGGQTNGFGAVALSDTSAANTTTNQIGWYYFNRPYYHIGGVGNNSFNGAPANSFNKFAIQYSAGTANFWVNGINIYPNRSIPVFDYRYLVVNSNAVGATYSTDKIALFNRTLTNYEITGLTFNPTINTGISAYYKLDGNAIDSSFNCASGTTFGIDYVSGKTGSAARFKGGTDRIDIIDNDSMSFTDGVNDLPFSINVWVNFTGFNTTGNWIVNKRSATAGAELHEWQLAYINSTNRIQLVKFNNVVGAGAYQLNSVSFIPTLNTWYNITATDNGTKTLSGMNTYVNGVLLTGIDGSVGIYTGLTNTTCSTVIGTIGAGVINTTTTHLGYIEDVGIWKNRVLTQSEITNLYNSGSGRTYPF